MRRAQSSCRLYCQIARSVERGPVDRFPVHRASLAIQELTECCRPEDLADTFKLVYGFSDDHSKPLLRCLIRRFDGDDRLWFFSLEMNAKENTKPGGGRD